MKKIKLIILYFVTLFTFAIGEDSLKIAFININEIYQEVPQGKYSVQKLQDKLLPESNKLQKQQEILLEKIHNLQKDSTIISQNNLNEQQKKLKIEQEDFKNQILIFKENEAKQEQKIAQYFQIIFNQSIREILKEEYYDLILNSQAIVYINPDLKINLTSKVINIMKSHNILDLN